MDERIEPDFYTVRTAAEHLCCSEKTVYKYIRRGVLHAKKGVRPYLIPRDSMRTFVDSIDERRAL